MSKPTKAELRAALLQRRGQRDAEAIAAQSAALLAHLLRHPLWQQARGIAAYVGVRGEPDTWGLLAATLAERKRLWLPRMVGNPAQIAFVPVADLRELAPGGFGLLEPPLPPGQAALSTPTAEAGIDLVLVPGLGFARDGTRIGFGKGHYDRALAPVRDQAAPLRIGVCLGGDLDPVEGQIPREPLDVPMHWVATPDGLHFCGKGA
ncbi:MAG: 5-formyltetrahydrofolate cyclo-ligase [Nannocystis sp.]|nr:5-formyltetrahydrofolate cyclo-ligase [Nannocystis sp.]MBA3545371.1 5-formyltetrahydrofolate cyclo-ligase [Nannocystis sp.]